MRNPEVPAGAVPPDAESGSVGGAVPPDAESAA